MERHDHRSRLLALIWGRHDRANRLRVVERAGARYGWPLHAIENCADDPPRGEPQAFVEALRSVIGSTAREAVAR